MSIRDVASWVIVTGNQANEKKLTQVDWLFESNIKNETPSVFLLNEAGYRLEYSIKVGNKVRYLYTWRHNDRMFDFKRVYSVASALHKAGFEIVGTVDEMFSNGALYWLYSPSGEKLNIKTLYYENVRNGFYQVEDFDFLEQIITYPSKNDKTMIVLSVPLFTSWFARVNDMLFENEDRY